MKNLTILTSIGMVCCLSTVLGEDEKWPRVSMGEYVGYGEMYAVDKGNYTISGCTNLGNETSFSVTKEGVVCGGNFYKWEVGGFQADRDTKEGHERINFLGKAGNVVVADLTFEEPKGNIVTVIRMTVAPAPPKDKEDKK